MPALFGKWWIAALVCNVKEMSMREYHFSLVIASEPLTQQEILDATDTLGEAGCTDASIRGHPEGMELLFDREAKTLQAALSSAIKDVENAGFRVLRIEMAREAISI